MRRKKTGVEPMPILIRGRRYSSAKMAAKWIGVTRQTIYTMNAKGRIDNVGTGPGAKPGNRAPNEKPIRIGPIQFDSQAEASRRLGYSRGRVHDILKNGGPDARAMLISRAMALAAKEENALRAAADERKLPPKERANA